MHTEEIDLEGKTMLTRIYRSTWSHSCHSCTNINDSNALGDVTSKEELIS